MKTKLEKSLFLTLIPRAFYSAAERRKSGSERERKRGSQTVANSHLGRVQRINNAGPNVKQRRLRMIFAEVVAPVPRTSLPSLPCLFLTLSLGSMNKEHHCLGSLAPSPLRLCLLGRSSLLKSC